MILSLRREIADLTKQQRVLERDLMIEQEKYAKLKDKLIAGKGLAEKRGQRAWRKRPRRSCGYGRICVRPNNPLPHEHTQCLRLSQEAKDTAAVLAALQDEKRRLETRLLTCEARIEKDRDEMATLRARNDKLSRQHEDTMWVAKSDVVELERRLKEAQEELARCKKASG